MVPALMLVLVLVLLLLLCHGPDCGPAGRGGAAPHSWNASPDSALPRTMTCSTCLGAQVVTGAVLKDTQAGILGRKETLVECREPVWFRFVPVFAIKLS